MFNHTLVSNSKWNKAFFGVQLTKPIRIFIALVFLFSIFGSAPISVQAATVTFTGGELLGMPTDTSITINIVPASTIEYYYEYGTTSGAYSEQTVPLTAAGGQPHEVTITGLSPNTRYYYRMIYDGDGDVEDGDFEVRDEHAFQTQRAEGGSFAFTVTSDSHGNFGTNTATNILGNEPDFHVDIGDTFMVDNNLAETQSAYNGRYEQWRGTSYFGGISQSVPIYLAMGNHEEEEGWNLDDTPSRGILNIEARKLYFPMPTDDGFYTGNTDTLALLGGDQLREDYYAWEWGDALFMVIDPFQYTMNLPYSPIAGEESDEAIDGNQWSWTLGDQQYNWLKQTLENSDAKYKFVFSHNMVGGVITPGVSGGPGYVRGGAGGAPYFEWGGYNADGSWGFATERPGWDKPIHQLFVENGVSAYFHGHDHQYVYEKRDGVVYQEVPSTSMSGSGFGGIYTEGIHTDFYGDYSTVEMLPSGGHLRISITPTVTTVDYIAASGGGINYFYEILPKEVTEPDFTITATAGANGSISPSGEVGVIADADQSFTITPNSGYQVDDVRVDGASEGAITSYTFTDIQANHTIEANFVAAPPTGAVIVDGATSSATANEVNSISFAHTSGTGADRLMLVGVSWNSGSAERDITSVIFNDGTTDYPLSEVIDEQATSTTAPRNAAIYSLLSPPSGASGTLTVTFDNSVSNGIVAGAVNFAGVNQADPFGTPAGGTATSSNAPTVTLSGLNGDEFIFDNVFQGASDDGQTLTAGADQAEQWTGFAGNTRASASVEQAAGSSVTMNWTAASASVWVIAAIPINPAPFSGITYELTMANDGNGTTDPVEGTHTYAENAVVGINAIPNSGYIFDSWAGDADCEDGSVTMDTNKNCTATFIEAPPIDGVIVDGTASSGTADGVNSIDVAHTTGTGTHRLMLVGVSANSYNSAQTISSVTFTPSGGSAIALTEVGSVENEAGRLAAIYSLVNPPSGQSGTVTVTFSGSVNNGIVVGVANFSGVNQANPMDDFVSAVGTESSAVSLDVPADIDDLVFDTVFLGAATPPSLSVGASQSELWDAPMDRMRGVGSVEPATTTTTPMSWTVSGGSSAYFWAIGAVPINPVGSASEMPANNIVLGRPTNNSVTVNAILEQSGEVSFEYGTESGVYSAPTTAVSCTAGDPVEVVLSGLLPNTQHFYRMLYRATSTDDWIAGNEYTFYTQRDSGETFTFTVISDSHLGDTFSGNDPARYEQATLNVAADNPDFHLDLGDTFVMNDPTNQDEANDIYLAQRPYFGNFSHSAPVFLAIGNHENEEGWNLDDTPFSKALASITARKQYFLNPVTDGFYSGNEDLLPEIGGDQLREDYYAWEWGDALFVVLDPFQYTMVKPYTADPFNENETVTGDQWEWTLGLEQFLWFQDTLENSNAPFKFVFAHHMVGGMPNLSAGGADAGYVRLGAEAASYYEWGGLNGDDSPGFSTERPEADWGPDPIHQLMMDNGVNAFFHGHDHQYVHEERDGIVYQLVPSASMANDNYGFDLYDDSPYAVSGGNLPNAGHLRVTVSPDETTVEYVRAAISGDTGVTNRQVNHPYTILPSGIMTPAEFSILLGRPTDDSVTANIIPDQDVEFYIEYGTSSGSYTGQTGTFNATADEPIEVVIDSLSANEEYFYRIVYRQTGTTEWSEGTENSFQTQRAPGSTFTFTIISDSHLGQYGGQQADELALYEQTLSNVLADQPDFHIDNGDTFAMDPLPPYGDGLGNGMTEENADAAYLLQRPYLDAISASVPIYLAIGNHENEEGWNWDDVFDPPEQSLAIVGMKARKKYYPNPIPDGFYTGNTDALPAEFVAAYPDLSSADPYHEDYYAWEWGDALFVILDPYHYSMTWPNDEGTAYGGEGQDGEVSGDRWDWTLGIEQYLWLKETLENSDATYKFVFSHHVTGGSTQYGRGGISAAPYFEWGGLNADGTWGWDTERPSSEGWDVPIHQLFVNNGVNAYIHGHDHIYAYEELDGIAYLEVPKPDDAGYTWEPYGYGYNEDLYPDAIEIIPNSGHIRVTVSPTEATFDYVRSYLAGDGANGQVAHSFTIPAPVTTYDLTVTTDPTEGGTTEPVAGAHTYDADSVVDITATPASGYEFDHWSGDCTGTGACQVTMDTDKDVTAHFTLLPTTYELTVTADPTEGGTTEPVAGAHTYDADSVVDISATPAFGYGFDHWSGECSGTGACQVTMDGDKAVTAHFAEVTIPTLPSSFYGEIHIYDDPPTAGETVEAYVSGVAGAVASTTVTNDAGSLQYRVDVPGDDGVGAKDGGTEGDTVTFMIAGRIVATGEWHSGTNTRLDFHPPEAVPGGPYSGVAGTTIDFSASANDYGSDVTTYEWDWDNDGAYDESGQSTSHTWADYGNYTVGLKVTDAQGGEGSATVAVAVENEAPVLALIGDRIVDELVELAFTASAEDEDPLTFSLVNAPAGANITSGGDFTWTPGEEQGPGEYTFTVEVCDDQTPSLCDDEEITVTVNDVNVAPVLDAIGDKSIVELNELAFTATATDNDLPANALTFSLSDGAGGSIPTGATIGSESGQFLWTPTEAQGPGEYTFDVCVSDGAQEDCETLTVTVIDTLVTHSIALVTGWNLVSFNVHPADTAVDAVLSSVDGSYDLVYAWDAIATSANWRKYDPSAGFGNSLTDLDETMGFWIHMTEPDVLDVLGTVPDVTTINLSVNGDGWNLVGYPSMANRALPGVLSDHGAGDEYSLVYAYHADDTADPWKLYDREAPFGNDLSELAPGWGFWVKVSADNSWSVRYLED